MSQLRVTRQRTARCDRSGFALADFIASSTISGVLEPNNIWFSTRLHTAKGGHFDET